jgi:drug/metabolite transporter (DMT)-like permease
MFALYGLLTRYAARRDTAATSFFWTGTVGAVGMTAVGIWFWQPMTAPDWRWMAILCLTGALGHWLLIKCYEVAEASAVQPFAYLQLAFASALGITLFGETVRLNVALGVALIVSAGLFTLWREQQRAKRAKRAA